MNDVRLKPLLTPEEVLAAVRSIASDIERDYGGGKPVLVGILNGAFVFMADLLRSLGPGVEADFVQATSYSDNASPIKDPRIIKDVSTSVTGKDVIIVEGIVDSGRTVAAISEHLAGRSPASIRLAALLVRDSSPVRVDYTGRTIGAGFVAGYGMDYRGRYRGLPGIYVVE